MKMTRHQTSEWLRSESDEGAGVLKIFTHRFIAFRIASTIDTDRKLFVAFAAGAFPRALLSFPFVGSTR